MDRMLPPSPQAKWSVGLRLHTSRARNRWPAQNTRPSRLSGHLATTPGRSRQTAPRRENTLGRYAGCLRSTKPRRPPSTTEETRRPAAILHDPITRGHFERTLIFPPVILLRRSSSIHPPSRGRCAIADRGLFRGTS